MRIAFCRYNQNTDLDFAVASIGSRNTEERLGILEAFVELGHDVTIVSWVTDKHQHALRGESKGDFDNSWMKSLTYDVEADMQQFDVLFVETSATNTVFSFVPEGFDAAWADDQTMKKFGMWNTGIWEHGVSAIAHFATLLDKAKDVPVVIYHHGNRNLAFPFSRLSCMVYDPMTDEKLAELSPVNYRNIFKNINIWDHNDYTVWHKATNTPKFVEIHAPQYYREEMNLNRINFVGTNIGYSPRYDKPLPVIDPVTAEFDLCYVGRNDRGTPHEGGRPDRIHKFYDSPDYTSLLVGRNWEMEGYSGEDVKKKEKFGGFGWRYGNVTTPGQSKFHGDVFDHYRRATACVQVLPDEMADCGLATTRHQQAIMAGVACFMASDVTGGSEQVGGEEFIVYDAADVLDALETYCSTKKDLEEAVMWQRKCLVPWTDVVQKPLEVALGKADPDDVSGVDVFKDLKKRSPSQLAMRTTTVKTSLTKKTEPKRKRLKKREIEIEVPDGYTYDQTKTDWGGVMNVFYRPDVPSDYFKVRKVMADGKERSGHYFTQMKPELHAMMISEDADTKQRWLVAGGDIGVIPVRLAKQYGVHVVAYEPIPERFELLKYNAGINGVGEHVLCIPYALAFEHVEEYELPATKRRPSISAEALDVLEEIDRHSLNCMFLNMDGAELEYAQRILQEFYMNIMIIETHMRRVAKQEFRNFTEQLPEFFDVNMYEKVPRGIKSHIYSYMGEFED